MDYDIVDAFQAIEKELIDSMLRNYKRHQSWESDEGFNWPAWQTEQLKALQKYRHNNSKKFKGYFNDINSELRDMLEIAYKDGNLQQEKRILNALKSGYNPLNVHRVPEFNTVEFSGDFFKINDRKLDSLIKATTDDFIKAEHAVLRKAEDQYRQTIFNAQVYANTGSGTYEQSIDMATKDFLAKGINCIEYKNGAMVNIVDYVAMAIQTAQTRAYLQGEGAKRQEWGISTVLVITRGGGCPKCTPFQGKVFIDDVWSGGSSKDGNYPLISNAIKAGLYHPRCKDSHTTYFEGITEIPKPPTEEELKKQAELYNAQLKRNYMERQVRKYENIKNGSLDATNRAMAEAKAEQWKAKMQEFTETFEFGEEKKDYFNIPKRKKKDYRTLFQINRKSDAKMFEKYKNILGEDIPKTLEEFQNIKYNKSEEWNKLTRNYGYTKTNNLLKEYDIEVSEKISDKQYIVNNYNPEITQLTEHAKSNLVNKADRINMTMEKAQEYISNAKLVLYDSERKTVKFMAEDGYSVLSLDNKLVTAVPQKWRKKFDKYLKED